VQVGALAALGGPREQAAHLAHFRADAIVRDAEAMRRSLIGDEPWTVLGPSFGGCCVVSYLSFAPDGLSTALVSGGLPGLRATADDVYRRLYPRVLAKNAEHYARHPEDRDLARRVAGRLAERDVRLRDGRRLTVEAFQSLGRVLGLRGGVDRLHYLLETAFTGSELSDGFLLQVEADLSFVSGAPLYLLLHEAAYAQGAGPTGWSAQRIRGRVRRARRSGRTRR
jgi:hypothetical protein